MRQVLQLLPLANGGLAKFNSIFIYGRAQRAREAAANQNPVFKYEAGDSALVCDVAAGAVATLFWFAVV